MLSKLNKYVSDLLIEKKIQKIHCLIDRTRELWKE